ncbi:hypothetical protein [Kribbella sp. NPDC006257]|uniref:hypothetical protein n=1 Tax=Kribbella sp. NPDC006257 TaxID=3156738 RepID=UPI0033B08009
MARNIEVVPILSRGRHRNPRRGGCFMEYASYLAGVAWSDAPECTHPLLALVAREVNDEISDAGRAELVPLIPDVIGLTTDDPRLIPALVARCVRPVIPVVSKQFGVKLAGVVDKAEAVLEDLPNTGELSPGYEWEAPLAVAGAIRAITDFRAPDSDGLLHQVLSEAIAETRNWLPIGGAIAVRDTSLAATRLPGQLSVRHARAARSTLRPSPGG